MLRDAVTAPGSAEIAPDQFVRDADDAGVRDVLGTSQRIKNDHQQWHQKERGERDQHRVNRHPRENGAASHAHRPCAASTSDKARTAPARTPATPEASPPPPTLWQALRAGT